MKNGDGGTVQRVACVPWQLSSSVRVDLSRPLPYDSLRRPSLSLKLNTTIGCSASIYLTFGNKSRI